MDINLADTIFKVWLVVPIIGHIRITAVFTLVVAFFCVICGFRSRLKDAFYQAVVLVGFATSIYEIVFNPVAAYVFLKTIDSFIQHLLIWHYIMVGDSFRVSDKLGRALSQQKRQLSYSMFVCSRGNCGSQ